MIVCEDMGMAIQKDWVRNDQSIRDEGSKKTKTRVRRTENNEKLPNCFKSPDDLRTGNFNEFYERSAV